MNNIYSTREFTVSYGCVDGVELLAYISLPEIENRTPVILGIHGGRWLYGDRNKEQCMNIMAWSRKGYAAMSIDYRLLTCAPAPACLSDVFCAIRFIHSKADVYNFDINKIYLYGMSAGGHLAAMAAVLGPNENSFLIPKVGGSENYSSDFKASICLSGAYDLTKLDWGEAWNVTGLENNIAREFYSPIKHITENTKPILIVHSENDSSVPFQQALEMIKKLKEKNNDFKRLLFSNFGHVLLNHPLAEKIAQSYIELLESENTSNGVDFFKKLEDVNNSNKLLVIKVDKKT